MGVEHNRLCRAGIVIAAVALHACSSGPPQIVEYFDEETVTAIVRIDQPVLFMARHPQLASVGGDMISVGPLSTILSGEEKHYLWCGFWTTIDRFRLQEVAAPPPSSIVVQADGENIELQFDPAMSMNTASYRRFYPNPSPGVRDGYYRVSVEQMRQISRGKAVSLIIASGTEVVQAYLDQSGINSSLRAYLEYTTGAIAEKELVLGRVERATR